MALSVSYESEASNGKPHMKASGNDKFVSIFDKPNSIQVFADGGSFDLHPTASNSWAGNDVELSLPLERNTLRISLSSPKSAIHRIQLRWLGNMDFVQSVIGDAWERAYGDLEWRSIVPDRPLPWYCATQAGDRTHCYGVQTGANAFCFWQVDMDGVNLWLDARSGGSGLQLDGRTLDVCEAIQMEGKPGETPFAVIHAFCRELCPNPRLPQSPVYGHNDWYYAYGNNSASSVLGDADRIISLSPQGANRPFVVIDAGWQPGGGVGSGVWDHGNEKFPDMPGLAASIRAKGAKPGIWMRPMCATENTPKNWRLPRDQEYLDPTVPDALQKVHDDVARIRQWGYELIKHDFTSADILGLWGFQMGASPTKDGWAFQEGSGRTTCEILKELYQTIRNAAGDSLVLGCNTISNLSAGVFEMCRIGDDTSGREWARPRKMGVNCLGFRSVQQGAFYDADPDCVGVTQSIPWEYNRQWLDLVARSGTMLFVSLDPDAMTKERERDLKTGLEIASKRQPVGEPLDWQRTISPELWKLDGFESRFRWIEPGGVSPFS